jgi:hypothetical protein
MFEFADELFFRPENDYETQQLEVPFMRIRKNSFIDLLSYEKSTQDSDLEGINIDHCSLALPILQTYPQEFEQVKLLLDDFPDLNVIQRPKNQGSLSRKMADPGAEKAKNAKIGTLTIQERLKKIEKYLEKKKKRTWVKKIHYNCRKKVADKRLRIKGRFVTSNKKK